MSSRTTWAGETSPQRNNNTNNNNSVYKQRGNINNQASHTSAKRRKPINGMVPSAGERPECREECYSFDDLDDDGFAEFPSVRRPSPEHNNSSEY